MIKKPCKYCYKLYLENIKESPVWSQNKWVQELGVEMDDRHTSILPLLGLQEILSFKTFSSNVPMPLTLFFSNMALKKQNYALSVQKLKRVYCICFGNAPI